MKRIITIALIALFAGSLSQLYSQSTTLIYKEKGKTVYSLTVSLSTSDGSDSININDFLKAETISFTLQPVFGSEKIYFKENDVKKELSQIKLFQSDKPIEQVGIKTIGEKDKIEKAVFSFNKTDILLYDSLIFMNELDTSKAIKITEIYYEDYNKFKDYYNDANHLINRNQPDSAFSILLNAIEEGEKSKDFNHLSMHNEITSLLPEKTIVEKYKQLKYVFDSITDIFKETKSLHSLNTTDSIASLMNAYFISTSDYTTLNYEGSTKVSLFISEAQDTLAAVQHQNHKEFEDAMLAILEEGTYSNYKFSLFVELLAHDLIQSKGFDAVKDGIFISNTASAPKKEELEFADWMSDFDGLIYVLNKNAHDSLNRTIFNPEVIQNLKLQKIKQPKPYYEFFNAINSLSLKDDLFIGQINEAIRLSPDEQDVLQMEHLLLIYTLDTKQISENTIKTLNEGLKNIQNEQWEEAESYFKLAIKQASDFAPAWFYLAISEYYNGDTYSSDVKLSQASQLYPEYIAPDLFKFRIYLQDAAYDTLLKKTIEACNRNNIYLFHFWKAKAHYQLKQYNEAISELNSQCLSINSQHKDSYFLIGDCYVALKQYEHARSAYQTTQVIDPFESDRFNDKMREIQNLK